MGCVSSKPQVLAEQHGPEGRAIRHTGREVGGRNVEQSQVSGVSAGARGFVTPQRSSYSRATGAGGGGTGGGNVRSSTRRPPSSLATSDSDSDAESDWDRYSWRPETRTGPASPGIFSTRDASVSTAMMSSFSQPSLRLRQDSLFGLGSARLLSPVRDSGRLRLCKVSGCTFVNQYMVVKYLGRGSSGRVFLCMSIDDCCLYAVKIVKKELTAANKATRSGRRRDPLEDLRREIAVMRRALHPNIVALREVVDDAGSNKMLLVMEYAEGGPVMTREGLERGHRVPEEVARLYFRDMCKALDYLHCKQRVVHGDLKPENALMGASGCISLSDFGCSKVMADDDGEFTRCNGTPAFLAPEMMRPNARYRGRPADLYALGCCLYSFVFGRIPFRADTVLQLFEIVQSTPVTFPEGGPEASDDLKHLLLGLLEKDPERRMTLAEVMAHPWITAGGLLPPLRSCRTSAGAAAGAAAAASLTAAFDSAAAAAGAGAGAGGSNGAASAASQQQAQQGEAGGQLDTHLVSQGADPASGPSEPDPEQQRLLKSSLQGLVAGAQQVHTFVAGQPLMARGQQGAYLLYIMEGECEVHYRPMQQQQQQTPQQTPQQAQQQTPQQTPQKQQQQQTPQQAQQQTPQQVQQVALPPSAAGAAAGATGLGIEPDARQQEGGGAALPQQAQAQSPAGPAGSDSPQQPPQQQQGQQQRANGGLPPLPRRSAAGLFTSPSYDGPSNGIGGLGSLAAVGSSGRGNGGGPANGAGLAAAAALAPAPSDSFLSRSGSNQEAAGSGAEGVEGHTAGLYSRRNSSYIAKTAVAAAEDMAVHGGLAAAASAAASAAAAGTAAEAGSPAPGSARERAAGSRIPSPPVEPRLQAEAAAAAEAAAVPGSARSGSSSSSSRSSSRIPYPSPDKEGGGGSSGSRTPAAPSPAKGAGSCSGSATVGSGQQHAAEPAPVQQQGGGSGGASGTGFGSSNGVAAGPVKAPSTPVPPVSSAAAGAAGGGGSSQPLRVQVEADTASLSPSPLTGSPEPTLLAPALPAAPAGLEGVMGGDAGPSPGPYGLHRPMTLDLEAAAAELNSPAGMVASKAGAGGGRANGGTPQLAAAEAAAGGSSGGTQAPDVQLPQQQQQQLQAQDPSQQQEQQQPAQPQQQQPQPAGPEVVGEELPSTLIEAATRAQQLLEGLRRGPRDYLVGCRGPGDFVGEIEVLGGSQSRRVATVVAVSSSVQAAVIPYQAAKAYLSQNPLAKQQLAQLMWLRQSENIVLEALARLAAMGDDMLHLLQ